MVQVHLGPRPPRSLCWAHFASEALVKKLIVLALAAVAGYLVYRKISADRAEQDLWNEATAWGEVDTYAADVDLR